jgi:hypothetical protein
VGQRLGALALAATMAVGAVAPAAPPAFAEEEGAVRRYASASDKRAAMAERKAELLRKAREQAERAGTTAAAGAAAAGAGAAAAGAAAAGASQAVTKAVETGEAPSFTMPSFEVRAGHAARQAALLHTMYCGLAAFQPRMHCCIAAPPLLAAHWRAAHAGNGSSGWHCWLGGGSRAAVRLMPSNPCSLSCRRPPCPRTCPPCLRLTSRHQTFPASRYVVCGRAASPDASSPLLSPVSLRCEACGGGACGT